MFDWLFSSRRRNDASNTTLTIEHKIDVTEIAPNDVVVLRHRGHLSEEKYERVRAQWGSQFKGPRNSAKCVILEEGATVSIPRRTDDLDNNIKTNFVVEED